MGSFLNVTGSFGIYIAEGGDLEIERIRQAAGEQPFSRQTPPFSIIEAAVPDKLTALEFDPYSASLFVGEDRAFVSEKPPNSARIWRIDSAGNEELFATKLNFPNGMSFHSGGTMIISEDQNLLVADTRRNFFRRGDEDSSGVVDLTDVINLYTWLFVGGTASTCFDAADANDDGRAWASTFIRLMKRMPRPKQNTRDTDFSCT